MIATILRLTLATVLFGACAALTLAATKSPWEMVDTGLLSTRLYTNDSGSHVCLFGRPTTEKETAKRLAAQSVPTELRIISLQENVVTRRVPVDGDVRHAVVTSEYLFWVPKTVNVLFRVPLSNEGGISELPMLEPIVDCFEIGTDRLGIIHTSGKDGRVRVLTQASLENDEQHPLAGLRIGRYSVRSGDRLQRLGDGEYYLAGRIVNESDGHTKCIVSTVRAAIQLISPEQNLPRVGNALGAYYWRRNVSDRGVTKRAGPELFKWQSRQWDVSKTRPVAAILNQENDRVSFAYEIELRELVHGRVLANERLPKKIDVRSSQYYPTSMQIAGDRIVVLLAEELIHKQVLDNALDGLLEPLRLLHPNVPVQGVEKQQDWGLSTRGGRGAASYTINVESPHIRLNDKNDGLEVDWPALWNDYLSSLAAAETTHPLHVDVLRLQNESFWNYYQLGEAGASDEPWRELVAVSVTLSISVADQSGQNDQVVVAPIALAPRDKFQAAVEKGKAILMEERKAHYRQARVGPATQDPELLERVNSIEERLARIEKLLEAIAEGNDRDND